jgi:hypothetical protein
MRKLQQVLSAFYRIYETNKKFENLSYTPDVIRESQKNLLDKTIKQLKEDYHFDVIAFLETPNGQEALHTALMKSHIFEKAADRCNMCGAYTVQKGCKLGVIGMKDPYPPTCKKFVDAGFNDRFDRIIQLLDRCRACKHFEDGEEYRCQKNLDIDEIHCSGKEDLDEETPLD